MNQYGRKVLLYILKPRHSSCFLPEVIKVLEQGDGNPYRFVYFISFNFFNLYMKLMIMFEVFFFSNIFFQREIIFIFFVINNLFFSKKPAPTRQQELRDILLPDLLKCLTKNIKDIILNKSTAVVLLATLEVAKGIISLLFFLIISK